MKRYKPLLLFLVLIMIWANSCKEDLVTPKESGSISGKVIDSQDGTPVSEAVVSTSPPTSAVLTSAEGRFTISNAPSGKYTIFANKSGYLKNSVNVLVQDGQGIEAVLPLTLDNQNTFPAIPSQALPLDGSTGQPVSVSLSWHSSDADKGDSLRFDICLHEANAPSTNVAVDYPDTSITVDSLKYHTSYFWQVIAKDNRGGVTPGPIWHFQTRAFPDNRLLFASQRDGDYEIYSAHIVVDSTLRQGATITDILPLTDHINRDWWPRMSPKRDKIAFISNREVTPHIYTIRRDGSGLFKVTNLPVAGFHNYGIGLGWSPDGTQLLYANYNKLYRIDANDGGHTLLATAPANRHFREISWSPLGDKLVALTMGSQIYDSEIYQLNADGSNMTLLVSNWPGIIESPSFSPDGKRIIFTHDQSGLELPHGRQLDSDILILNIANSDTTNISYLKTPGTNDLQPRFSPDGAKIIFTNTNNDGLSRKDIWIMDVNGEERHQIIADGEMPDWR